MLSSSLKTLLVVLCTVIIIVESRTRTCAGNCRCSRDSFCTLRCRGEDQCKESILRCRSENDDCKVYCDGKAACSDSEIDAKGAEDFNVKCEGEDACKSSDIDCDYDGTKCVVNCDGKASCSDTPINAGDALSLTVVCDGEDACKGSTEIRCPESEAEGSCMITCSESTSCDDVTVINGGACTCSDKNDGGCVPLCNNGCDCVNFPDALSVGGRMIGDNQFENDGMDLFNDGTGQITLNMSKNTIINLWSMALLFVIINIGIYVWMNRNRNNGLDLGKAQHKFVEE